MNLLKRAFSLVWDLTESVAFALGLVMVSYLFLFQTGEVHGASSYPTWKDNERFITDKVSYHFSKPRRGDFIVLQSPGNAEIDFIKRIIGLPGETVKITGCRVYINNSLLDEQYLQPGTCTGGNQEKQVPANYYFVMGDNRDHSSDSRDFGPVPESSIVGKVALRFWPPDKFGIIR